MGYNRSRSGRGSARGKPRPSSHAAERPTSTRHPLVGVLVIVTVALVLDAAEALDIGSEMNESGHVHVNLRPDVQRFRRIEHQSDGSVGHRV